MHESLSESDDLFKLSAAEFVVAAQSALLNECRKKGMSTSKKSLSPASIES